MFFSALCCIFTISIIQANHPSLNNGVRKINNINVLLPVISEQVSIRAAQYELEAYGGCYNWEVSKPEFLKIIPIQQDQQTCTDQRSSNCAACFNKCIIQVNSNNLAPGIIWINAIDKITNDQIQVECRLGKLSRIEILTKFRTVDVNEIQMLEVIGYDEEGNAFSSLEGLKFQWKIEQSGQFLEFVPIKDSQIKTSEYRKKLETPQFSTDIIIVRGLTVGRSDIKVSIKEENQNVASANVTLYVIEQFILFPETNHLYFLTGQSYKLKIFQVKKESKETKYEQLNVPSKNFEFSSQDNQVASIDQSGTLETIEIGQTIIDVKDRRTASNTIMTNVYVVDAIKIEMRITEFKDNSIWDNEVPIFQHQNKVFNDCWNLVVNRFYYLKIQISDSNDNLIYLPDKSPIQVVFPDGLIEIISQKQNQQYKILAKKLCSDNYIQSIFQVNGNQNILQTSKMFQILSQVKIIKPSQEIHLPYIEKKEQSIEIKGKIFGVVPQLFQLFPIGGSSSYHYQIEKISTDNNLSKLPSIEINQDGLIITQLDTGRTKIIVSDKLNKDNNDNIFVNIQKIGKAEPLEKMKELLLESDKADTLFVLASDTNGKQFSNCSEIQFNIQNTSSINFIQSSPLSSKYQNNQIEIHSLIKNNIFFQQILFTQNDFFKQELYQNYIDEKIISQEKLLEIFQFLDNRGICSKIALRGKQQGTYIAKIELHNQYSQIDSIKQFGEIKLKIINPITISNPITQQRDHDFMHIIMSFGSSFELKLNGGPTKWQDERVLQIRNEVIDSSTQQIASNSLILREIQTQLFLATCSKPENNQKKQNKYRLTLSFQNTPDQLLPQPLLLQTEIRVSCNFPYYLKIFYLPYYTEYDDVLNFLHQSNQILNFRSERTFLFKIQAFDSFQKPFYNISSLQVDWQISNPNFGQIEILESFQQNYIEKYIHHLIRNVKFFNQEGIVKLSANTKSIQGNKDLIYPEIVAEIQIHICKNVQVSPTQVLMYVNHTNIQIFFLHFGSGNFALKEFNQKNEKSVLIERDSRKFTVQPLSKGQTNITIIDLDVQSSQNVSVLVEVQSVDKIIIYLETYLLPIGKTTKLIYEVYSNGHLFPPAQHQFMDIDLIIESDRVSEGQINDHISYYRSKQQEDAFIIQSKKSGQFKIYALFKEQKIIVKSEFQEIELFENLRTEPSYVLIAPECVTHIYILGGPVPSSLIQFVYQADQDKLINIVEMENRQFMIKGLQNGTSEIQFLIKQINNDQILTQIKLPIQVSGFNRVLFNNVNERVVHLQTKIRLISELYLDKRQFNQALCPFMYKWTYKMIDHSQVILMQENLNKMNREEYNIQELDSLGEMHKFAVNISMLSQGFASIQLDVQDLKGNFKARNIISFNVINPIIISVPSYIGQPLIYQQPLLLPPNSNYKLPIVRQGQVMKYIMQKECQNNFDNININENGVVQVGSITHDYGLIQLQIEDQKQINKQSQIVSLIVTSISSIFIENSFQMLNLQLGSDSILDICLQDSYGRSFPNNLQNVFLVLDISNKQIIEGHIDNNLKLQLTSRQAGASLIKVYLQDSPSIYDQFLVIVGSIITPRSPIYIHTGGVIQFRVETTSYGNWTSENSDILYIDLKTGLAQSLKQGKATIIYQSQVKFKTVVTIYQITEVLYKDEHNIKTVISNYKQSQFYKEIYWFQIEAKTNKNGNSYLRSVKDFLDETSDLNNNLQIECKTSHPNWVSVQYEEVRGMPFCKLVPKSIKYYTDRELIPSFITLSTIVQSRNMALIITLPSKDFKLQVQWEFVVPFKILKLNKLKPHEKITILTPQRLEIKIEKSLTDTMDLFKYMVYIYNSERNSMEIDIDLKKCELNMDQYILIKNTNTQQEEKIRVNYSPSEEDFDEKVEFSYEFDFQDFLLGLVAIAILGIVITQFGTQKQPNYRMQ